MTPIHIKVSEAVASADCPVVLTSGMVGLPVRFTLEGFDGLEVTAVFRGSGVTISVPLHGATETVVPWEVMEYPRTKLSIGVEGRLPDGTLVIPTTWADVGCILPGANASDDLEKPPTPTAYDRIMSVIGNMDDLSTDAKDNLVAAINEAYSGGGGDITLGINGATVGQIAKIKAVDDTGKPTAWEPVDMAGETGGESYWSWSKVWALEVAEDIAGFTASNIDLDGKSEIMVVFISDSTASRTMVNGRLIINDVDAGKVLFNSLALKKDSHTFVIIGRADHGIEYTTMAAKAEYQTYPWQGDVNVIHRMVSGTNSFIPWIADSTIEITQGSATLGKGVTIEIYVR